MYKIIKFISILLILLILCFCSSDDSSNPEESTVKISTMSFDIEENGEIIKSYNFSTENNSIVYFKYTEETDILSEGSNQITIYAQEDKNNPMKDVFMIIIYTSEVGIYDSKNTYLTFTDEESVSYFSYFDSDESSDQIGDIKVSLNNWPLNNTPSKGTFSGSIHNTSKTKEYKIVNGTFSAFYE